jgi:type I restriction enzyme, S subunit
VPINESTFPPDLLSAVNSNMVAVSRLTTAQFRLDASAFVSQDQLSAFILDTSKSQLLSELAEVFTVYIQSPILAYVRPFAQSRPYMTTSELAEYKTERTTHVSLLADARLDSWEINKGNIIVSRSGRVGEAYWVDGKLDGALVGDSFRVIPKNKDDGPFLYAVLSSSFARDFLSGSAYGSVVDHASVDQLRKFPLPHVTPGAKAKITAVVKRALEARDRAYGLLDESQKLLLAICQLPKLDPTTIGAGGTEVVTTTIRGSELILAAAGSSEFRLEAHFYNPVVRAAIGNLQKSPFQKHSINELSHDVIMGGRFKRNYVDPAYGTPFLSGRNIIQIRPTDLNYVSNTETKNLSDLLVKRGWILVTCSGTIGRTCFVWNNFEKFASSQHILRVVPDEAKIDPAYLSAFLASEYGYQQIIRFRHGSVIDELTDHQLKKVIVPVILPTNQQEIGDLVRLAYDKRAEAIRLEDEAHYVLMREITGETTNGS